MSQGSPDPTAALAALRERYRAGSGRIVEAFRALARRLAETPTAPDVLEALRRELHRIRGTAGSYGFTGVSELVRKFEPQARQWSDDDTIDTDRRSVLVRFLADAIEAQFAEDPAAAMATLGRPMAIVGLDRPLAEELCATAPVRGYSARIVDPAAWLDDPHRAMTQVLVTSAAALPALQAAAVAANVPIVAVAPADGAVRLSRRTTPPDGVLVVAADGGADDVLAFADRASLRAAAIGATLLVLDDDPMVLELVRHIVEPDGIRVETLSNPERLLPSLEAVEPTVLLIDVHMEGYDGIALLRGLRSDPRWAELPVLVFSSSIDEHLRANAYAAAADDFIVKPIVAGELTRRLRARIEAIRLRRLGAGCHPGTGLPLPDLTARDVEQLLDGASRDGLRAGVALLRPPPSAASGAVRHWLDETLRIARALGANATVTGFIDDVSLLIARKGPAVELAESLRAVAAARPSDAPGWHAGMVEVAEPTPLLTVRAAAEAALSSAVANDEIVHLHEATDETRPPDVVIVEDDLALSDMLQFALRAAGFTYRAYANGSEALDAMLRFDRTARRVLVLLDVDLPGLDGHTVHERLRLERPGQFAVAFCSLRGSEAEQLRAIDAGAIDWLTKPLSLRVLMAKVRRWRELAGTG